MHLQEIKSRGLLLNTDTQKDLQCIPDYAGDSLEDLPTPDLCLVCVKGYDLENIAQDLQKHIKENTVVIPLLNGVDIYGRLRAVLTRGIILPACVYITSHIEKPGMVIQKGPVGKIVAGRDPRFPDFDPGFVVDFLGEKMGLDFHWEEDPKPAIWTKYVLVASFALVTAYANKSFGEVMDDPFLKECLEGIMREIILIGQKKGIPLKMDLISETIQTMRRYPYDAKTSYQLDLEVAGKKNEGDLFGGTILRMGEENDVNTPVTRRVFASICEREGEDA